MAKTNKPDRKTRAGILPGALSPLTSLTDKELKTLSELCDAGIESNISPRFTKELTRIKGKLRRGF